jgi:uncharacterized protein
MNLVLSIAALLLGPAIYAAGRKIPIAKRILNASILLTIALIIAIHIIPEALAHGGNIAIVVILAGLVFPMLLERLFRKATATAHLVIVALAATGLLVHAVVDGIALLPGSGTGLAFAIVLHRLPVGMAVWWAVRPNFGKTAAVLAFALIILATSAGYFVGDHILAMADGKTLAMLQAFVSGSLIHVVAFGVKHDHH